MEFADVVRRRRMRRNFRPDPVGSDVVDHLLDAGRRAPSAGWAQGTEFLVLEGAAQTDRFWACTFTPESRARFGWPGLFHAPVLIIPMARAEAYLERYAEGDKAAAGLGEGEHRWPVPYWIADAAMASENILLAAVDEGLGALFFGIFHGEQAVLEEFGVAPGYQPIGAIAVGHHLEDDPGRSSSRSRRTLDDIVHRGAW